MRCTRKYLNCTAHAGDDQNNGGTLSAHQAMIEHTPHAIQLYLWIGGAGRVFFFGARIRLRMTFNYPVLWVRVKGQC